MCRHATDEHRTLLRFILLAVTRRPVLSPPTPQREFDPALIPQDKLKASPPAAPTKAEDVRPVIPEIGHRAPLRAHLYPLVSSLPEAYQMHPLGLVPELCSAKEWLSEILHSTTPLVQVLLFCYAVRNPKSKYRPASLPTLSTYFYPFLVPLAMQLLARHLRAPTGDSTLLAEHYAKTDRRLATRFFLTGPMWVGWTRPKVMSVVRGLQRIPLIGLAGGLLEGYLPLVDEYYCELARAQRSGLGLGLARFASVPELRGTRADGRHGIWMKAQCIECVGVGGGVAGPGPGPGAGGGNGVGRWLYNGEDEIRSLPVSSCTRRRGCHATRCRCPGADADAGAGAGADSQHSQSNGHSGVPPASGSMLSSASLNTR